MKYDRTLTVGDDGTARFTRTMINGAGAEHLLEDKRVALRDVLPATNPMEEPLPRNCRFRLVNGETTIFVLEDFPQTRTIAWDVNTFGNCDDLLERLERANKHRRRNQRFDLTRRSFTLAFPYVVKVLAFDGRSFQWCSVHYRTDRLQSLDDMPYKSNLMNQWENGGICSAEETLENLEASAARSCPLSEIAEEADRAFWESERNDDIPYSFLMYAQQCKALASPWHWEAQSQKDPFFMLRVPWQEQETLREYVSDTIAFAPTHDAEDADRACALLDAAQVAAQLPDDGTTTVQHEAKDPILTL